MFLVAASHMGLKSAFRQWRLPQSAVADANETASVVDRPGPVKKPARTEWEEYIVSPAGTHQSSEKAAYGEVLSISTPAPCRSKLIGIAIA
jgi:hypothetical protein